MKRMRKNELYHI